MKPQVTNQARPASSASIDELFHASFHLGSTRASVVFYLLQVVPTTAKLNARAVGLDSSCLHSRLGQSDARAPALPACVQDEALGGV